MMISVERAAGLFPLVVTAQFAAGGKSEVVLDRDRLVDAVLEAVTRSPIATVVIGPVTPKAPPEPDPEAP